MKTKTYYHIRNDGTISKCTAKDKKNCPYNNSPHFQSQSQAQYYIDNIFAIKDTGLVQISKSILFEDTFNPIIKTEEKEAMIDKIKDKSDLDEFYIVLLNKIKYINHNILAPDYEARVATLRDFYDPYEFRSYDERPEKRALSFHSYNRIAEELSEVYSNSPEQQKRLNEFIKLKNNIRGLLGKSPLSCKIIFKPKEYNKSDNVPPGSYLTPYIQEIDENGNVIKETEDKKLLNRFSTVRNFKNAIYSKIVWERKGIYAAESSYQINDYKFLLEELKEFEYEDVMNNLDRKVVSELKNYEELLNIVLHRKIKLDKENS